MGEQTAIDLRKYVKSRRKLSDEDRVPEFDSFLADVDQLFQLRVAAEDNFKLNPHLARVKIGALPLDWEQIKSIISPDSHSPKETLVSQIAKTCLSETEDLLRNLRKVLVRKRDKVSLGQVQQVDSHCLRWLTRQPGRSTLEKAGARQQVLAIVRNENFNTLENRVFKDFMYRASMLAQEYLRKNENIFEKHSSVKSVRSLSRLCENGLKLPEIRDIRSLSGLPAPNYVLQQDRRYSKIWKAYCLMVQQADITERLWKKHGEVFDVLYKLIEGVQVHTSLYAKYASKIWFNPLDGKRPILDMPFWDNELDNIARSTQRFEKRKDVVIDLAVPDRNLDLFIYSRHANAKAYIQDFDKPCIEDIDGEFWFLQKIIDQRNADKLRDYFEQLYAVLGGKRWTIIVPDDWDAYWQETVITAVPLLRRNVFLLWRSVAALIGSAYMLDNAQCGDSVAIVDVQQEGRILVSELLLAEDSFGSDLVPQRKSYVKYPEKYGLFKSNKSSDLRSSRERLLGINRADVDHSKVLNNAIASICNVDHIILLGKIPENLKAEILFRCRSQNVRFADGKKVIDAGVEIFARKQSEGLVAYFDELEALSLVVQTKMEKVLAKVLVKAEEKFPGGKEYIGETIDDVIVRAGESKVLFYLYEGVPDNKTPLQIYSHDFSVPIESDSEIRIDPRMTPGQGLAIVNINASFIRHPIKIDLRNDLKESDMTISEIEKTMKRHFPPDMPFVEASHYIWDAIKQPVLDYIEYGYPLPVPGTFAQAQEYFDVRKSWGRRYRKYSPERYFDENTYSPIDRLKRENVFGNDPGYRYPCEEFDFELLFKRLSADYQAGENVIRLIAWTYQFDNPLFESVKNNILDRYERLAEQNTSILKPQEYTLCSNLVSDQPRLQRLFQVAMQRVISGIYKDDDLRLIYNLLQFHPETIEYIPTERCEVLMAVLSKLYKEACNLPYGPGKTKIIGYILKPMLFLLHKRRYDRDFFRFDEEWGDFWITLPLGRNNRHEPTRKAFVEYVNGRGTLEGIPGS